MQQLSSAINNFLDKIKDSEFFQQIKSQYDELDAQVKSYVNIGAGLFAFGLLILPVFWGLATVSSMKSEIATKEELIGFLTQSADQVKHLKALQDAARGDGDVNSPLPAFADNILQSQVGLAPERFELLPPKVGFQDKDIQEALVEVKLKHVNIRHVVRSLFAMMDQGTGRKLNIKDLTVDTKNDPEGYMDASFVLSQFKPKN